MKTQKHGSTTREIRYLKETFSGKITFKALSLKLELILELFPLVNFKVPAVEQMNKKKTTYPQKPTLTRTRT